MRRVAVVGLGCICPVGSNVSSAWKNILNGVSGIVHRPPYLLAPVKEEPEMLNMQIRESIGRELWARVSSFLTPASRFALIAAAEALKNSGILDSCMERNRIGTSIGNGICSIADLLDNWKRMENGQASRVSPHLIPKILGNTPAGLASIGFSLRGPNHSVSTACAAGLHAVGDAFLFIQSGMADAMLAGGTESCLNPLAITGFSQAKALATREHLQETLEGDCSRASQPFNHSRNGFIIGEGAGMLVLEEMSSAIGRKATIYAEILGYGASGDAHHMTAPLPSGEGALLSMKMALRKCEKKIFSLAYINAHATGTPLGDAAELRAISTLCSEDNELEAPLFVSSTKGSTGHLLGAAGAVEAIFTALSAHQKTIPPNLNFTRLEPDLQHQVHPSIVIPTESTPLPQKKNEMLFLCNSIGFGGTNSSICFKEYRS